MKHHADVKKYSEKLLRTCCYFILNIFCLLGSVSYGKADDLIIFGANESPPYWSSLSQYGGMGGEIVKAISEEVDLKYKIEFSPLKRLIDDDENNDLGNPEFYMETQSFAAIIPIAIYNSSFIFYQTAGNNKVSIKSVDDLKKYKVGALKGTQDKNPFFRNSEIYFEPSYSQESLIKKLKLNRIDLSINIDLVAKTIIRNLFPGEVGNFKFIKIQGSNSAIAIMISDAQPKAEDYADKIRWGLNKIIGNGRYHKIIEKYYGVGNMPVGWFNDLKYFQSLYNFEG